MGICVYFVGYLPLPMIITLLIQIVLGATIYIAASAVLKLEEFEYLLSMIKIIYEKR